MDFGEGDGVALRQRSYAVGRDAEQNVNTSGGFLFVLPTQPGRLRLSRSDTIVHDGPVVPGMVRIVRPFERSTMSAQSAFRSLVVRVPQRVVAPVLARRDCEEPVGGWPAVLPTDPQVQRLTASLGAAGQVDGALRSHYVEGLVAALVAVTVTLSLPRPTASPGRASAHPLDDAQWAASVAYAETALDAGLTVDDWSQQVGLSADQFSRRFRARSGQSPYAWFLDRRIERSKVLLAGGHGLVDVAIATGFSSQSHFNDAFYRRVGVSPGQWRRAGDVAAT